MAAPLTIRTGSAGKGEIWVCTECQRAHKDLSMFGHDCFVILCEENSILKDHIGRVVDCQMVASRT